MRGVKKFFVQEAIASAFFTTLIGGALRAKVYLFDYGPMLQLFDPDFVKTPSKYRRGILNIIYARLLKIMTRFSLRHCEIFFLFSREMRKCAVKNGLNDEKIVFYDLPVNTRIFASYDSSQRKRIREEFGFRNRQVVITFVGRISADKGLPYILESAEFLVDKYASQIKFVLIGKGPLVNWLLQRVNDYGKETFLYLGPIYDPKKLADILNASDIFVYPITVSYGYALAALEAMATGLPSIITDVGPTMEVIENWRNGIVIPAGNVQALTEALDFLVANEGSRKRIGENAGKVLVKFSLDAYQETIVDNIP